MDDLTISLVQADLYWEQPDANMAMFEEKIWNLEKTDLIILPEMFTTGFSMNAEKLAEPVGGKTFKWMRQMAKQKNAAVTGSYIVKEGKNYFNRLYFVYPDGSSNEYDKKHLFTLANEHETYVPGDKKVIIDYRGWKICPLICYDLRFPVWSRSQKTTEDLYQFDLLLYVANWPDPRINAWDTLLAARSIENHSYCVGVNRIGTDDFPKDYPGHSGIYSFKGDQLSFSTADSVITATLSSSDLEEYRKSFPFQADGDNFNF
ncbi:MAG: amidohydrolase [Cyclobacteriaceae bacterium]